MERRGAPGGVCIACGGAECRARELAPRQPPQCLAKEQRLVARSAAYGLSVLVPGAPGGPGLGRARLNQAPSLPPELGPPRRLQLEALQNWVIGE